MKGIYELIIPGTRAVRNYAEKLLADVRAQDFASKPKSGEVKIDTNHPAFIMGHLCLYPSRVFRLLGLNDELVAPPPSYPDMFAIGSVCHDDPECTRYPKKEELVSRFLKTTDIVIDRLPQIPDSSFTAVNTEERSKDRYPLVGAFVFYLLTAHANGHLGQISVWRRCMGLGSAL